MAGMDSPPPKIGTAVLVELAKHFTYLIIIKEMNAQRKRRPFNSHSSLKFKKCPWIKQDNKVTRQLLKSQCMKQSDRLVMDKFISSM